MSEIADAGLVKSYTAGAALKEYRVVKFDGNGDVVHSAAAADFSLGVTQYDVADEKEAAVILTGEAKVTAGAVIVRGALLTTAAGGKVVTAVAGNRVIGIATSSAAAVDNNLFMIVAQGAF